MLGKSGRIKSKLQEKKEEERRRKDLPPSLFFPLFHNIIYIKCFFVTMQIFLVFSGIAATVLWDESAKRTKNHPIDK